MRAVGPVPEPEPARPRLGPGRPVPAELRARAESALGVGLDGVRLHDGPAADALARRHAARAFTVGSDVVFHSGHFRPDTADGRRLIAHELAHVGQQTRGGPATSPAHEMAADSAAAVIVGARSGPATVPGATVGVQREPLVRDGRAGLAPTTAPTPLVDVIKAEVADIIDVTTRLAAQVPVSPEKHARNAVRLHAQRIAAERDALIQLRDWGGDVGAAAAAALPRVEGAAKLIAPVVEFADKWHRDNPMGSSLGQDNERAGTWLAGKGASNWEAGGWSRVTGAAAYTGAFAVAMVDAAESLLSFGFHEAATMVAEAYARGDISWDTGVDILWKAAWRSLLTAAISATAGYGAGRLVGMGARAVGLGPGLTRVGLAQGAVSGGVSSATGLATTAAATEWWRDSFTSPEARRIFAAGMPSGRDWAIAIPLGMLLGAAGGAKAAADLRATLVGKVVETPVGRARIAHVSADGKVAVLEDVARARPAPPPPPAEIIMVFDPATGTWRAPGTAPAAAPRLPAGGPASPAAPRSPAPAPARPRPPAQLPAPQPQRALPVRQPQPEPSSPQSAAPRSAPVPGEPVEGVPITEVPVAEVPVAEVPVAEVPVVEPPTATPTAAAPQPDPVVTAPKPTTQAPPALAAPQPATPARPATANARDAGTRVAQTQDVLRRATDRAAAAHAELNAAQGEFDAAVQLLSGAPTNLVAVEWHRMAAIRLGKARAGLAVAQRSASWAAREAADVGRAAGEIGRLEQELARLGREIDVELNPPGGFTAEQQWTGRRRWIPPRPNDPSGARYRALDVARTRARLRLADEVTGLRAALRERVEKAVPGPEARGPALQNAAELDATLRPINGRPVDVETGMAMTTDAWATDHIVSRTEIAADPRFARLTPTQQEHMLRGIPENYLPMRTEVNSSKGGLTVTEWLARRRAAGKGLPKSVEDALVKADQRARRIIDERFTKLLGE